ncbi:MAG: hypothetical protein QM489_07290 [Candidatus Izemoplasma sp.]
MITIRPSITSALKLSIINGYVFISFLFVSTKLWAPNLVISLQIYLLLFIIVFLIVALYLSKRKIGYKDGHVIFYRMQIFITHFRINIKVKEIDFISANFHKNQFSALNFISLRANKTRYRIPIRTYKREEVLKFIEVVKMAIVIK